MNRKTSQENFRRLEAALVLVSNLIDAFADDLPPESLSSEIRVVDSLIAAAENLGAKYKEAKHAISKAARQRDEKMEEFDAYVSNVSKQKSENERLSTEREQYRKERIERQRVEESEAMARKGLDKEIQALKGVVDTERARTKKAEEETREMRLQLERARIVGDELIAAIDKQREKKRHYKHFITGKASLDASRMNRVAMQSLNKMQSSVVPAVESPFVLRTVPQQRAILDDKYIAFSQDIAVLQRSILQILRTIDNSYALSLPLLFSRAEESHCWDALAELVRRNLNNLSSLTTPNKTALLFVLRKYPELCRPSRLGCKSHCRRLGRRIPRSS